MRLRRPYGFHLILSLLSIAVVLSGIEGILGVGAGSDLTPSELAFGLMGAIVAVDLLTGLFRDEVPRGFLALPFLALLVTSGISQAGGLSSALVPREFLLFGLYSVVALRVTSLRRRRLPEGRSIAWALLILFAAPAASMIELAWPRFEATNLDYFRAMGPFAHPNVLGTYSVVIFTFAGLLRYTQTIGQRYQYAMMGSALIGIALSRSLTALVTLVVVVSVSAWYAPRRQRWKLLPLVVLTGFTAVGGAIVRMREVSAAVTGITSGTVDAIGYGSLYWRFLVWERILESGDDRPLLGHGLGSLPEVSQVANLAHNDYLRIWIEGGWVGTATFVLFLGALTWRAWSSTGVARALWLQLLVLWALIPASANLFNYTPTVILLLTATGWNEWARAVGRE